jgi:uncharacterized protein YjiS (DUF1127 family)
MASVIALHRTAASAGHRTAPRLVPRGFVGRLRDAIAGAIRRDHVRRELLRLSDRQLRDIGLERHDLLRPGDVHLAAPAQTFGAGKSLLHVPGL